MTMPEHMPGCEFNKLVKDKHCKCQAHRLRKAGIMAERLRTVANNLEDAARGVADAIENVSIYIDSYWYGLLFFPGAIEDIFPQE